MYYDVLDHQCIDGHVKCADGIQCIGEWEMCNGDTKCNDESDEIPNVCKGNKRYKLSNNCCVGVKNGASRIILAALFCNFCNFVIL